MNAIVKVKPQAPAERQRDATEFALIELEKEGTIEHLLRFTNIALRPEGWTADELRTGMASRKRVREQIAEDRAKLASFPSPDALVAVEEAVDNALVRCTEQAARQHLKVLLGCYPNARPPDPEAYVKALLYDVADLAIPDAIVALTAQQVRRTCKFVPTISEFLDLAQKNLERFESVTRIVQIVENQRSRLADSIEREDRLLGPPPPNPGDEGYAEWRQSREDKLRIAQEKYPSAYIDWDDSGAIKMPRE